MSAVEINAAELIEESSNEGDLQSELVSNTSSVSLVASEADGG